MFVSLVSFPERVRLGFSFSFFTVVLPVGDCHSVGPQCSSPSDRSARRSNLRQSLQPVNSIQWDSCTTRNRWTARGIISSNPGKGSRNYWRRCRTRSSRNSPGPGGDRQRTRSYQYASQAGSLNVHVNVESAEEKTSNPNARHWPGPPTYETREALLQTWEVENGCFSPASSHSPSKRDKAIQVTYQNICIILHGEEIDKLWQINGGTELRARQKFWLN